MKKLVFFFLITACDTQAIKPCRNIPDGGCPLTQDGVECQDPTCAASYACTIDGTWVLDHTCSHDGGNVQDASIDAEGGSAFDANIDAPPGAFGGPGCVTLQTPDCPLGQALLCSSGCCGCEDLFVCNDGGWDPWGTCSDAGINSL